MRRKERGQNDNDSFDCFVGFGNSGGITKWTGATYSWVLPHGNWWDSIASLADFGPNREIVKMMEFKSLAGIRTKLGVATAISGGVTLILNGLIDVSNGMPGWTKIGAGLVGIGTALGVAGIRWSPQFVALVETLQTIRAIKTDTTLLKTENNALKTVLAKVEPIKPAMAGSTR